MSYWPLDTPYRPATVKEALRLIPSQLASVKVRVDILIVLSWPHLSVKNLSFPSQNTKVSIGVKDLKRLRRKRWR